MPSGRVRVVGSNYTTFNYRGKPIAYCEQIEDSGQRAFADSGTPYQYITPLGANHPVEIATSRVLSGGTLNLTIRELWNAPVWQQLNGMAKAQNIVDIYTLLAKDPAYVTCSMIIKPPGSGNDHTKWRGKIYNNCFSGETEFLTDEGTKTLAEMAGQHVRVLGRNNAWQDAQVQAFGEQSLKLLTLSRQGVEKQVYVTDGHRWIVTDRTGSGRKGRSDREVTTAGLVAGDHIANRFYRSDSRVTPSPIGIQAGIVYGDGNKDSSRASNVTLWGNKDAALLKFFPLNETSAVSSAAGVPGIKVVDLPGYFKDAPSLRESRSYLLGWMMGYFAADGSVDANGSAQMTSRSLESIRLAHDVCQVIGVPVMGIREVESEGYNGTQPSYSFTLDASAVGDDFFLIEQHRDRVEARSARPEKKWSDWTVVSVEETDRTEQVYCAVVPNGHEFTLADNVRTGNCTIVEIGDGDTVTVGTISVVKNIVVAYTHSQKLN